MGLKVVKKIKKKVQKYSFPSIIKASTRQKGRTNKKRDNSRIALSPGKRMSKYGKKYTEHRRNRSDITSEYKLPVTAKRYILKYKPTETQMEKKYSVSKVNLWMRQGLIYNSSAMGSSSGKMKLL